MGGNVGVCLPTAGLRCGACSATGTCSGTDTCYDGQCYQSCNMNQAGHCATCVQTAASGEGVCACSNQISATGDVCGLPSILACNSTDRCINGVCRQPCDPAQPFLCPASTECKPYADGTYCVDLTGAGGGGGSGGSGGFGGTGGGTGTGGSGGTGGGDDRGLGLWVHVGDGARGAVALRGGGARVEAAAEMRSGAPATGRSNPCQPLSATGGLPPRVLVLALALAPAPARAADPDDWFGPDKALHFAASSTLAIGGYAGAGFLTDQTWLRLVSGAAVSLTAGVAKELWDFSGHGDPSWKDLTWDVIGCVVGLAVALAMDVFIFTPLSKPPQPQH